MWMEIVNLKNFKVNFLKLEISFNQLKNLFIYLQEIKANLKNGS